MKRSEIIAKAREYVGTPFQHQGRLKGIALDCVGLPLCVGEDLGIIDRTGVPVLKTDNANYSSQPLDAFVHLEIQRRLFQKESIEPGDVITLCVPRIPCHVAIVSGTPGNLYMIHAYEGYATKKMPRGGCVEHVLDSKWLKRIEGIFAFPGAENG